MGQGMRPKRRVVIDPKVHFGKPCVAGTKYYPDLRIEDVKACARYAREPVRSEEIHRRGRVPPGG